MRKLADMDLTIVAIAFILISLILALSGAIPRSIFEGIEVPLISLPPLYLYSLLAGFGVFLAGFIARLLAKVRYLNWKRIAVFSLLIPVLVVHAYPLFSSPYIALHIATPVGEVDLPSSGHVDGQWLHAELLLRGKVTRGIAKYSIILVDKGETPYALIDGKGNLTPQLQILASRIADIPIKTRAPDGCYKISMSADVIVGETTFAINDYVGETCVEKGYMRGARGLPAETKVYGPSSPTEDLFNAITTAVTLATFILTAWKGEAKGRDLLYWTLFFLMLILAVKYA